MTFTEEMKLPSSDKFYMVRVEGAALLTKDNLTFVSTVNVSGIDFATYEGYLPKRLVASVIFYNASDATADVIVTKTDSFSVKVGGTAPYYNTFYYNPETGYIKLSVSNISSVINNTDSLVLSFFLFFTQFTGKRALLNFEDGNDSVYWEPRLPKEFSLAVNQQNSITGQFSTSSQDVQLKNNDLYFNDFCSQYFTFSNREVKVWRCINTVDDFQFEYSGVVKGMSINDESFNLDIGDRFTVLDDPAYGGFEGYKYYSDFHDGVNYNVRGDDRALPIYRLLGKIGPYDTVWLNTAQDLPARFLDTNKMLPSVCTTYNPNSKTTATNRTWSCGFGPSVVTVKTKTVTAHNHLVNGTYSASLFTLNTTNNEDTFCVGDTFRYGTKYGVVMGVYSNLIEVWPYDATYAATGSLERAKVGAVIIVKNDIKYYPKAFRDYNCIIGLKGDVQVVFVNNFEANHSGLGVLDPDTCTVFSRMYNDEYDSRASEITRKMLVEAGVGTGSTFHTFAPDQTIPWADPYCIITLPFQGDSQFPQIRDVIQKCMTAGLGMLYFDSYGGVLYRSLFNDHYDNFQEDYPPANIVNVSETDPDDEMNQGNTTGFTATFDLYDQYVGTYFEMSCVPQNGTNQYQAYADAYKIKSNSYNRAKRLYKSEKFYVVNNCVIDAERLSLLDSLAVGQFGFFDLYNKIVTGRRVEIKLTGFSRHFNLYVGDTIKLERKKIVGNSSDYFRVIGISKGINDTEFTLTDNKRFPR